MRCGSSLTLSVIAILYLAVEIAPCAFGIQAGKVVLTLNDYPESVSAIAFSPSSQQFASACGTTIWVRDTKTGAKVLTFTGLPIASPMSHFLQMVYDSLRQVVDSTIRFWDLSTGNPGLVINTDRGQVTCIAFSPDIGGQHLVSGHAGAFHEVHLWDNRYRRALTYYVWSFFWDLNVDVF